jgi:hypothetical protein
MSGGRDVRRYWIVLTAIVCFALPSAAAAQDQDGIQKLSDVLRALGQSRTVSGNLIVNGSFEEPLQAKGRYATVASGQSFAGWQVTGVGSVSPISGEYRQAGILFNARHGGQWLDLTGPGSNSAAGVQQAVSTQPGVAYELVFYVGNVRGSGFGTSSTVEVYVDGQSVGTATNDKFVAGRQGWGQFRIPVTARATTTTIGFVNRDPAGDNSNGLDDVSLVPATRAPGGAPAALALTESFETPATSSYTTYRRGQSFTTGNNTWSVLSGSVDVVNTRVSRETVAFDGAQTVDLAGSPGAGVIAATFATTPGQTYRLTFHYARNARLAATPARAQVEVIGAATLLQTELRHDAATRAAGTSVPFNGSFVADGAMTTLRFTSLNQGNAGLTVDGISVEAAGAAPAAPKARSLAGEYVYQGRGVATVSQIGDEVRMFFTWTPQGQGPHYEARGRLAGDTITGEWYSHYAGKGWFRLIGKVRPNGDIDLSQSDDPINANIRATVLTRKR